MNISSLIFQKWVGIIAVYITCVKYLNMIEALMLLLGVLLIDYASEAIGFVKGKADKREQTDDRKE